MPDGIQPVGAMVQPPSANNALGTLSSLYGVKQAQQNLQTGQYTQAATQADSQQAQQRNQELQKAQQVAVQGAQSGAYDNGDGGIDRQKLANDILKVAPVYGQSQVASLLSQANEITTNKRAVQSLTVDRKKEMGDSIGSLAADPNVDNSKVIDTVEKLRAAHPNDPEYSRLLTSQMMHLPNTGDPKVLQDYLGRWSAGMTGTPQVAPSTLATPGGTQGVTQNRFTGAVSPSGAPVAAPPRQTTNAAGQIVNVTPGGAVSVAPPNSAAPPGASPGPPANPTTAEAATQNTIASGVTGRVQQAQSAANNTVQAQDALTRARSILDNADSPNTGANFENKQYVKNFLAGAGIDTKGADDANTLAKNLARYEASRATQAGLGGTDAARELAHNGSPNVSLDKSALKGVITQSLATEKALAAYAGIQSRTKDPAALAKNETDFRSIPNLIQGYEYGLARNPKEADEFLTKHGLNRADMAKTRAQIKEFEGRGQ